jgi:hypothetical protein
MDATYAISQWIPPRALVPPLVRRKSSRSSGVVTTSGCGIVVVVLAARGSSERAHRREKLSQIARMARRLGLRTFFEIGSRSGLRAIGVS